MKVQPEIRKAEHNTVRRFLTSVRDEEQEMYALRPRGSGNTRLRAVIVRSQTGAGRIPLT